MMMVQQLQQNDMQYVIALYNQQQKMDIKQDNKQDLLNFWTDSKIAKFIARQVQETDLKFRKKCGGYLLFDYQLLIQSQYAQFIVLISKGFPLVPPIVHANSIFTTPSIKDCRDILVELIGQEWHWQITLKYIINKLPKFIKKIMDLSNKFQRIQKIGQFHYNKHYQFEIIKELTKNNSFISLQKDGEDIHLYVLTLTATHILLFKPSQQPEFQQNKLVIPRQLSITTMKLIFCADVQALAAIHHNRINKNEYFLAFTSFNIRNMEYSKIQYHKTLNITRSAIFIDNLLKILKNYNMEITIDLGNIQIEKDELQLISNMHLVENKIKFYFNNKTIVELFQAYLKLVEYYSANMPPYQGIYLYKISRLLRREDVELILSSANVKMEEDVRMMITSHKMSL